MKDKQQQIARMLQNLKLEQLNDMQEAVLNAEKNHKTIQVLSPTGTGKTLGYLIPLILAMQSHVFEVQGLIICPTRELVLQIESVFKKMQRQFSVTACYGGHPFSVERNNLAAKPQLIIGTPGRLLDHFKRKTIAPDHIHQLVLDEFDKSLEFGFHNEMKQILARLKGIQKKYLISATDMQELPSFLDVKKPHSINFLKKNKTNHKLQIQKHLVEGDKLDALHEVLSTLQGKSTIVFCNHRATIDQICDFLHEKQMTFAAYHGKMEQEERELSITQLRNGSTNILIATDLAARGLDIEDLDAIVHYHIPKYEAEFTHRNGRTARMHASGLAILLLRPSDSFTYLDDNIPTFAVDVQSIEHPDWITIKIPHGKKDKVNKIDVLGFLCKTIGLEAKSVGLIEIRDKVSYTAVQADQAKKVIQKSVDKRIKGKLAKCTIV